MPPRNEPVHSAILGLDGCWCRVYGRAIRRPIALAAVAFVALAVGVLRADGSSQARVGLILEQPSVQCASNPFQCGAYRGLLRAAQKLGVQAKAVAPSPTRANQYAPLFSYLVRHGYNLVIAVGFLELQALSQAAHKFPHVKFGLIDATHQDVQPAAANLEGTVFHTEEASYLAGYLAARIADQGPRPHVVSSVAGLRIPPVDAYLAGFRAGAKAADPTIRVLNTYTNDFLNADKCRHAARAQIADGSKVVFDVAGACGVGALEVAKQKHAYGIGVDIDQSYLGKFVLTSVVKNLNLAVYDFAKLFAQGRLNMGGNLSFDLHHHGVYLGKFSPDVSKALRRKVAALGTEIEQGKIIVPTTLNPAH